MYQQPPPEDTRLDFKREQLCLEKIKSRQIDGMIINPINPEVFKTHLEPLNKSGIPVVVLGGPPEDSSISSVRVDLDNSVNDAFKHLTELGHRKLGFILHELAPHEKAAPRIARFNEALSQYNLISPKEFLLECRPTMSASYKAFHALLEKYPKEKLPSAFVCMNDLLAIGAMRATKEVGLAIPKDISFVGVDDIPLAKFLTVSLTTISQPIQQMAINVVSAVLDKTPEPSKATLSGQLIIRESTGPAPCPSR
ncbi:MAG: substrate-binding domain-containing protein [Verrucomicrobiota bacterium]|nr:substrate-binding domain-containing protein [Verrucomicrobiota bacterium]